MQGNIKPVPVPEAAGEDMDIDDLIFGEDEPYVSQR